MCGIVAVIDPSGELGDDLLQRMRDRLVHRGPDGAGAWIGRRRGSAVGLGHRRLAIIDLSSAAAQPMSYAQDRLRIVFNGEIYNYLELRAELEHAGHEFRTRSDTEVLLAAYAQWGVHCLQRLNGMFAIALWDELRQELFVARDRFGEKPLFHAALAGGGIAIASEMKALFAHPDVPVEADEEAVAEWLAEVEHDAGPRTSFRGVKRLPPAHAMTIDLQGDVVRCWRWWTPNWLDVRPRYDERAAVERFRWLLERSVALRLRADVPIGSSLSGGLDSSALVAILASARRRSEGFVQRTFSARFDDDATVSEGREIDLMVAHAGAEAHFTTPTAEGLMADSQALHWHQEEPIASASVFLQWCVARLARDHGTTILLDGQGADELLGGYQSWFRFHQLDLADRGRWLQLALETAALNLRLRRASRAYRDARRRFDPGVALGIGALLREWRGPLAPARETIGVPPPQRGVRFRSQLAAGLQYRNLPTLLRYADRNAMAFSREPRLPYLDVDLVDHCLGLPDEALVGRGWQKLILRRAADPLLPPSITWRADKVGYLAPQDAWLRGPLRQWAAERLFEGALSKAAFHSAQAVRAAWDAHQSGAADQSWRLWRWLSVSEWLGLIEAGAWREGLAVPSSQA